MTRSHWGNLGLVQNGAACLSDNLWEVSFLGPGFAAGGWTNGSCWASGGYGYEIWGGFVVVVEPCSEMTDRDGITVPAIVVGMEVHVEEVVGCPLLGVRTRSVVPNILLSQIHFRISTSKSSTGRFLEN